MRTFLASYQTTDLNDRQFLRQLVKGWYILLVAVTVVENAVIGRQTHIPELIFDSLKEREEQ